MMTPAFCAHTLTACSPHVKSVGLTGSGLAVCGQVTTLDVGRGTSDRRQQY